METIYIQKGDHRLGELTKDGQYKWPALTIDYTAYQVPNVEPYYIIDKPDELGSRWFVILSAGHFQDEVILGDKPAFESLPFDTEADTEPSEPEPIEIHSDPTPHGGKGKGRKSNGK